MRARYVLAFWLVLLNLPLAFGQVAAPEAPPAIEPQRFDKDIQAFEAEDKVSMPPEGAVVVTGSSSIRRWHPTIVKDLAPLTIVPRGFGGSTMEDALYHIDRLAIRYKPRAIAIYEGDNDIGRYEVPPEAIVKQFEGIVAKIHKALPETRVYAFAVKPSVSRWDKWALMQRTNQLLKALCDRDPLLIYVDVATPLLDANGKVMTDIFVEDNLHLNPKGYRIWTQAVRSVLVEQERTYERQVSQ